MSYVCKYCHKSYQRLGNFVSHLHKIHNLLNTYDERYKFTHYIVKGLPIPKCLYCDKDIVVKNIRGSKICVSKECKRKYHSDIQKQIYINHPEYRIRAREQRLKYLSNKNNLSTTAWGKRAANKMSFLEKWFYEKIILQYRLTDIFNIKNEFRLLNVPYSMDFAFLNLKLDVELDGRCHFVHGEQRIEHDKNRDAFLQEKGWLVYRISYKDVEINEENTIKIFLLNIEELKKNRNYTIDKFYYENNIPTQKSIIKEAKRKRNQEKQQRHYNQIRLMLIDLKNNSHIDFSKFGWVSKAKMYLKNQYNFDGGCLHRYLKRYYPEFFDATTFIRKGIQK